MIVVLQVGGLVQIGVDKSLVNVEDGTRACSLLYDFYPDADVIEQLHDSTHLSNVGIAGFYVKHGWHVAFMELGLLQEVIGLDSRVLTGGEEMIGSHTDALLMATLVVGCEIAVVDGDTLR